uniref:Rap guanine nucleotide exchange factor 2 n=1 Tax=Aceria tosichella TaxID=561515 RepID=A0A6G1SQM4_9ACAR
MTMDRVYNQQQRHGFQQPHTQIELLHHHPHQNHVSRLTQQSQQQTSSSPNPSPPTPPPPPPPPPPSNIHQRPPENLLISMQQTNRHIYPPNQIQHEHSIGQQHTTLYHNHLRQPGTVSVQPILHRPVHPPPPPPPQPPPRSPTEKEPSIAEQDSNRKVISHFMPPMMTAKQEPTDATDSTATIMRNSLPVVPVGVSEIPSDHTQRNSLQHGFYPNTHFQYYEPTNLKRHPNHHNKYFNPPEQPQPINSNNHAATSHNTRHNEHLVADTNSTEQTDQNHYPEEVIQAIVAARSALEKPIEERDEYDILSIDNLCSLLHGFLTFPKSVRRALAAQTVLIVIDEKGKELIVHNEELDSFCVLIYGECEQLNETKTLVLRVFNVGDAFGVCEPTTETIRFFGHMVTKCENCAFLCVKRDDFYTILTDPANYPTKGTIRHRDKSGNVVCVSQFDVDRKTTRPLWSYHMQSKPNQLILPNGHVIIKATEACLLTALVDGYDRVDPDFINDFLLLFRVFMTWDQKDREKQLPPGMNKLCSTLIEWLEQQDFRDQVFKIVLTWLSSFYHDFELNPEFSYMFFRLLESRLLKCAMRDQLNLLHITLSTKSKIRHVTITRSSREQPLNFSIAGGYEKNCGIFVTQVHGASSEDLGAPFIVPRLRSILNGNSRQLRPGDQILEANGTNFAAIKLVEAEKKLNISTHLSLTVKYNPAAFHEMTALPEGRKKSSSLSSMSSVSSISQYPTNTQKSTSTKKKSLLDNAINPTQSSVNVLRVFNSTNNDFRYLLVHEETTAREVVMVAVKEFNLSGSSLNWYLYEVSVVPESRTIKQRCLSEQTSRLAELASLCSRFYIKNNIENNTKLDMGDDSLVNEILKENPAHVTLTSLNTTLLAVELTLADFDKFRNIEPQHFVYDTFFDCSSISSQRTIPKSWMQEYHNFADISNKEMFWVICEVLNERNMGRRVKIVKQFVRVAEVCSQLRNYNSMFAIISGLGHSCVARLKRTFEKLKPKYKNQLETMRSLFDPSKNMSNYRLCLSQSQPPAIPLFPQIKKDLTFTKEGRSIFVRESNDLSDDEEETIRRKKPQGHFSSDPGPILVNFAEIRQFTDRVRKIIYFSSVPYSNDLLTNTKDTQAQLKKMHEEWQMRKRIRHYISRTLEADITYDERVLYQKSLEVETDQNQNSTKTHLNEQRSLPPQLQPLAPIPQQLQPLASTSSPTLSKSSSLSSCSSFSHQLPNSYHLTSGLGKFGTESTESLRKLQSLSENVDDWHQPQSNGSGNQGNGLIRVAGDERGSGGGGPTRNFKPSWIFPSKNVK